MKSSPTEASAKSLAQTCDEVFNLLEIKELLLEG